MRSPLIKSEVISEVIKVILRGKKYLCHFFPSIQYLSIHLIKKTKNQLIMANKEKTQVQSLHNFVQI